MDISCPDGTRYAHCHSCLHLIHKYEDFLYIIDRLVFPNQKNRIGQKTDKFPTRKICRLRKFIYLCSRNGGIAQLARAPALQAGGRRFESVYLHRPKDSYCNVTVFFVTSKQVGPRIHPFCHPEHSRFCHPERSRRRSEGSGVEAQEPKA